VAEAHNANSAQSGPQLYNMPPMERGRRQRVHEAVDELWRCRPQTVAHRVCAPCVQRIRRHLAIASHARLEELTSRRRGGWQHMDRTMLLQPHLHFEAFASIELVLQQAVRLQGLRQSRLQVRSHLLCIDSASGLTARTWLICPCMLMTYRAHQFSQRHGDGHQVSLCTVALYTQR
jgi:hypothetical protein